MRRRWAAPLLAASIVAEAWPLMAGGRFGRQVIVRCRDGHLFTTVWIPFASFKAVRLGRWRFQRCPVGRHWALVAPVDPERLSDPERREAGERRDLRIP